jgi:YfiH family protein
MTSFSANVILPEWPAPENIKAIVTTRHTVIENLDLPSDPVFLKQVHGAHIVSADVIKKDAIIEADGLYTQTINKICAIKTADCLPLLLCDKKGSCVAAVHAGWRGLASGVIEAAVKKLAVPGKDLLAWMGPAIGPEVFEVGQEVKEQFPKDEIAFRAISDTKYLCHIYLLARRRLKAQGVKDIYGGTECTYTNRQQFYSYRRQDTGRILSLVWIAW